MIFPSITICLDISEKFFIYAERLKVVYLLNQNFRRYGELKINRINQLGKHTKLPFLDNVLCYVEIVLLFKRSNASD